MSKTIHWTDGTDWTTDQASYDRLMQCLDAVTDSVWGFDAILAKWKSLAAKDNAVTVDEFAPSEDDRAVATAAMERAVEHARSVGANGLGFEEPRDFAAFSADIEKLHQLFVTDVTHALPKKKR